MSKDARRFLAWGNPLHLVLSAASMTRMCPENVLSSVLNGKCLHREQTTSWPCEVVAPSQATYAEVSKNEWSKQETSRPTLRELVEEA